jgi:hypothetical protein
MSSEHSDFPILSSEAIRLQIETDEKAMGSKEFESSYGAAAIATRLGLVYHDAGSDDSAVRCFLKAVEIAKKGGSTNAHSDVLARLCLGVLAYKGGSLSNAKKQWRAILFRDLSGYHARELAEEVTFAAAALSLAEVQTASPRKADKAWSVAYDLCTTPHAIWLHNNANQRQHFDWRRLLRMSDPIPTSRECPPPRDANAHFRAWYQLMGAADEEDDAQATRVASLAGFVLGELVGVRDGLGAKEFLKASLRYARRSGTPTAYEFGAFAATKLVEKLRLARLHPELLNALEAVIAFGKDAGTNDGLARAAAGCVELGARCWAKGEVATARMHWKDALDYCGAVQSEQTGLLAQEALSALMATADPS